MDRAPSAPSLEAIARSGGSLRRLAARLPTYLADVREKPSWLPMFVLARTMAGRRLHWLGAKRVPPRLPAQASMFGTAVDPQAAADELRSRGIQQGFVLPAEIREAIAAFAWQTPCFGNFNRRLEFRPDSHEAAEERYAQPILSGHYYERIFDCPAAIAVQRDPLLADIAAHYLGSQARIIRTRLWWTFPTKSARVADKSLASLDRYHFDLDDWRTLKFFFYLTDVDTDSGPHVYVVGSHRRRSLKHQLTLLVGHPADEIVGFYGPDSLLTITGPAGKGFVEDPFGFHMGTVPNKAPRLMMEVGFGVSRPLRRDLHGEPVLRP